LQLLPQFISEFNSEKWSIFAEVIVNIKVVYYFLRPGYYWDSQHQNPHGLRRTKSPDYSHFCYISMTVYFHFVTKKSTINLWTVDPYAEHVCMVAYMLHCWDLMGSFIFYIIARGGSHYIMSMLTVVNLLSAAGARSVVESASNSTDYLNPTNGYINPGNRLMSVYILQCRPSHNTSSAACSAAAITCPRPLQVVTCRPSRSEDMADFWSRRQAAWVTLTFDLVSNGTRCMDNLAAEFGVSATFHRRVMCKHASD